MNDRPAVARIELLPHAKTASLRLTIAALTLAVGSPLAGHWWASDASLQRSFEAALSTGAPLASVRSSRTASVRTMPPVAGTEAFWLGRVEFGGGTKPATFGASGDVPLAPGDFIRWGADRSAPQYTVLHVAAQSLQVDGVEQAVLAVTCYKTSEGRAKPETFVIDAAMAASMRVQTNRPHAL